MVYFILNFRKDTVFNRLSGIGAITNFILFVILIMKAWEWFTIEHLNFDDPNHHRNGRIRFISKQIYFGVLLL